MDWKQLVTGIVMGAILGGGSILFLHEGRLSTVETLNKKQIEQGLQQLKEETAQFPVGTIIPSMLSPIIFQKQYGDDWVLANGDKISTQSKYAILSGDTITPDLRGMFLRGINYGRNDGKEDPEGENRKIGSYQKDSFKSHRHIMEGKFTPVQAGSGHALGYDNSWNDEVTSYTGENETSTRPTYILVCDVI